LRSDTSHRTLEGRQRARLRVGQAPEAATHLPAAPKLAAATQAQRTGSQGPPR
jgi:hypothetical protein